MTYGYYRSRTTRWNCFTRRCFIGAIFTMLVTIFFVSSQLRFNMQAASWFNKFTLLKNSWLESQYVRSWIQGKLLALKWESYVDAFCKNDKTMALGGSYTLKDYLKYTLPIGKQLGFGNGHSLFDNGCGCGAFLMAFNLTYKNVMVGGLDLSPGAIAFAKESFPDVKENFKIGTVENLVFVKDSTYDHAMTFFTFPYVSPEVQCKAVKEMLRIVKPGGSLYIGHNVESDCKTHIGIFSLPLCFWNEQCLVDRDDIQDIYYIKERDLFGAVKYCPETSAVFVHKKGTTKKTIPGHRGTFHCDSKLPPSGRTSVSVA